MKVLMGRCLLAAGIVRDFRFKSRTWYDLYLQELEAKNISYDVVQLETNNTGQILARIVTQYNAVDLIDL